MWVTPSPGLWSSWLPDDTTVPSDASVSRCCGFLTCWAGPLGTTNRTSPSTSKLLLSQRWEKQCCPSFAPGDAPLPGAEQLGSSRRALSVLLAPNAMPKHLEAKGLNENAQHHSSPGSSLSEDTADTGEQAACSGKGTGCQI